MRTQRSRRAVLAVLSLAFWLMAQSPAHAYVDPTSGSYLLQVLIGGLLGGFFAMKMFWRRMWGFLSTRGSRRDQ